VLKSGDSVSVLKRSAWRSMWMIRVSVGFYS
jgi:hypothetical protein